eukprot:TRINITY_DN7291_c0_g1_i2.p7 TRINITY_DN7291_c0_g1~~TRINITY_DN7291_c0_g1_i2.p7  ORF type:complete len:117 (-),score=2.78 TRINITY_DN7291_c0_g1_i2:1249-1599(-)
MEGAGEVGSGAVVVVGHDHHLSHSYFSRAQAGPRLGGAKAKCKGAKQRAKANGGDKSGGAGSVTTPTTHTHTPLTSEHGSKRGQGVVGRYHGGVGVMNDEKFSVERVCGTKTWPNK